MWAVVKGVLSALPILAEVGRWLMAFYQKIKHALRKAEAMKEYEKADQKAQETGDTSELEDAFRNLGPKR